MKIRKAEIQDLSTLAELSCKLWPHHTADEMLTGYRKGNANSEAAFFLAYAGETPIGFAQCQLRHDPPVGFFMPTGISSPLAVSLCC